MNKIKRKSFHVKLELLIALFKKVRGLREVMGTINLAPIL